MKDKGHVLSTFSRPHTVNISSVCCFVSVQSSVENLLILWTMSSWSVLLLLIGKVEKRARQALFSRRVSKHCFKFIAMTAANHKAALTRHWEFNPRSVAVLLTK